MNNIKILIGLILIFPLIIYFPIIFKHNPSGENILIITNYAITSFIIAYLLYRYVIKNKKIEENMKLFKKINNLNVKILENMNDAHTYEDIFKGVIKTLIENNIIFAGAGYLYLPSEKIVLIKFMNFRDMEEKPEISIPVESFVGRHCIESKKLYILKLKDEDEKKFYMSSFLTITNYYIYFFPIFYQEDIIGILECCTINKIEESILEILENIISHLGVGLNQLKLYGEAKRLGDELERKNKILEAQNKELQAQSEELQAQTEELRAQKMELEEYSKKLQQLQKYKSEFISNMSHELRTPLNSIIGLTDIILKESKNLDKSLIEKLKIINLSGKQLLNIINDILDLSKIDSGKIDIEKEKFNINEVIDYVVSIIRPQCENKNLKLNVIKNAKTFLIVSDRYKIAQILLNVLSNAVKYTPKGEITLSIDEDEKFIIFKIKDTGVGIPKNIINEIFEPFVSLGKKMQIQGTGLGLPLTKKLVVLLGGHITVKSKVNEGSEFVIYIPKELKDTGEKISEEKFKDIKLIKNKENPKILLADDDLLSLHEMTKLIKETISDAEIITATDGLFAKKIIEKEKIDLILLDLDMPKLSGYNLLDYMTSKKINTNVIIVTALDVDKTLLENYPIIRAIFIKGKDNRNYLKALLNNLFKKEFHESEKEKQIKIKKLSKDKYNILLVEDNFANRYLIKEILKNFNVEIDEAENGQIALNKLKDKKFDLILLDIQMPVLDGYETFNKIKNELKITDIPIIALTAKAMKNEIQEFKELGFDDILIKPLNLNQFLNVVGKFLDLKRIS